MRLIDADKLRDEVLKWLPSDPCGVEEKEMPYETDIVVSMMLTLDEAPSIDIVRCVECKHWKQAPKIDKGWCDKLDGLLEPTWYCADGERNINEN